ncbi:hypothetical protein NADFUDRAFT_50096 [Nadsonia fulvescens var. elongata DSM 6958]|uniref:Uncharacterized protein n=1 Tax=Nadsonia fulvescens var. elongata DSM 6958 TaxID=857566 RepID=A0A1E3PS67_9ASCO|nr:hypothetical protein NADFUDRAFT_50096 [Nadsonia fulvescens var. elongata DSM 6958]
MSSGLLRTLSPLPRPSGPKLKRYTNAIERALASWDTVDEWADYIAFLSKLLKAINSDSSIPTIPLAYQISVKLAQCLDPNLPSGVHQKTLEVYVTVFERLGSEALASSIAVWIPGLLPLMAYASTNLVPHLLELFNQHILKLPPRTLRHVLRPILLALLPGIEQESIESFDQTMTLIHQVQVTVADDTHFWQCFFLAIVSSPDRRPGALTFAQRYLPHFNQSSEPDPSLSTPDVLLTLSYEAQLAIIPEPGLLIRALTCGLNDSNLLVQRGFLDILINNLPLHSPVLTLLAPPADTRMLILAAASCVLRRDMSLNRRLWTWLLASNQPIATTGTMTTTNENLPGTPVLSRQQYFAAYGCDHLIQGLLGLLNHSNPSTDQTTPFKIALAIMDRWEIGSSVVPAIFLPLMRTVYESRGVAATISLRTSYNEILRSANAFFDGVEAINIWSSCFDLLVNQRDYNFIFFILDAFNVQDEEMMVYHMPLLLLATLIMTTNNKDNLDTTNQLGLKLINRFLSLIPNRAFLPISHSNLETYSSDETILADIAQFYTQRSSSGLVSSSSDISEISKTLPSSLSPATLSFLLLAKTTALLNQYITRKSSRATILPSSSNTISHVYDLSNILNQLLEKIPREADGQIGAWDNDGLMSSLIDADPETPLSGLGIANTAIAILRTTPKSSISTLVNISVNALWKILSRQSITAAKYHVESIKLLWQLQDTLGFSDRQIEVLVTQHLVSSRDAGHATTCLIAITNLWTHSSDRNNYYLILTRPLFLMIDSLDDTDSCDIDGNDNLCMVIRHWLNNTVANGSINRVFRTLVHPILVCSTSFALSSTSMSSVLSSDLDLHALIYYLRTLNNVLKVSNSINRSFTNELAPLDAETKPIVTHLLNQQLTAISAKNTKDATCKSVIISLILSFIKCDIPFEDEMLMQVYPRAVTVALDLLRTLLIEEEAQNLHHGAIIETLMSKLIDSIDIAYNSENKVNGVDNTKGTTALLMMVPILEILSPCIIKGAVEDTVSAIINNTELSTSTTNLSLIALLTTGFSIKSTSPPVLTAWVTLLNSSLPLFKPRTFLAIAVPLVQCLCENINRGVQSIRLSFLDILPEESSKVDIFDLTSLDQTICVDTVLTLLSSLRTVLSNVYTILTTDNISIGTIGDVSLVKSSSLSSINDFNSSNKTGLTSQTNPDNRGHQSSGSIALVSSNASTFLGNVISGVFSIESPLEESSSERELERHRKIVLLQCDKSIINCCLGIWNWIDTTLSNNTQVKNTNSDSEFVQESSGPSVTDKQSLYYISSRLKFRARKLLEMLYELEPLETLETFIELTLPSSQNPSKESKATVATQVIVSNQTIFRILHILDGARPRITVPHVLSSIYSRINPASLESKRSSGMSRINAKDCLSFLLFFLDSLNDDFVEDIFPLCLSFLKDVQVNSALYRSYLPVVLRISFKIAEKVDNVTFGEGKRVRKDMADSFVKLLNITLSARSSQFTTSVTTNDFQHDENEGNYPDKHPSNDTVPSTNTNVVSVSEELCQSLIIIVPGLSTILPESDRLVNCLLSIVNNVLTPILRSKNFPKGVTPSILVLLSKVVSVSTNSSKVWKSLVYDIIFDARFFELSVASGTDIKLNTNPWLSIIGKWASVDRERVNNDIIAKIVPSSSSHSTLFGATGWSEQDKAMRRISLKRLAFVIIACENDKFLLNLPEIFGKFEQLMNMSLTHNDWAIFVEVFGCLRAILVKTSPVHLTPAWPLIYSVLQTLFENILVSLTQMRKVQDDNIAKNDANDLDLNENEELRNATGVPPSVLAAACKLLDVILVLKLEEFRLHAWLFITDNMDAIFPSSDSKPVGVIDKIASLSIGTVDVGEKAVGYKPVALPESGLHKPILSGINPLSIKKFASLQPFFGSLSIYDYEGMYALNEPDTQSCLDDILKDLF